MNVLTKIASHNTSRLEKIAAAVAAIEEGYNPEEVIEFAAEYGIHPDEVIMGANLFGEASLEKEASDNLVKLASIIEDENTLPLVKVAAAVDLFAAGELDPDTVYAIGEAYGFDASDVDYIYASAYPELAKEAAEPEEEINHDEEKPKSGIFSKAWEGIKGAYTAKDIREGWGEKGNRDWWRIAKGAGKTGLAYGLPIGAGVGGYLYYKDRKSEDER